jgi:hypothetical protein
MSAHVSSRSSVPYQPTYIYQIGLVAHVQVVDDRGLVQVRELCHVVGLVELGGIDLVGGFRVDLLLGAVVALHEEPPLGQLFDDPSPDEGCDGILKPDVALAGEVVLALDDAAQLGRLLALFPYELGREGAHWRAVARRVGSHP